jgi:lipopolysaccharide transport system ATP-binding protein
VNAIEVTGVSKSFRIPHERHTTLAERVLTLFRPRLADELQAVDDVSLTVPVGSFTGIIGANGSGKSTLLKIIANIFPADTGTVRVQGSLSPLLELGLGFHRELTVYENAALYGAVLGYPVDEMDERVTEAIAFAELERFRDAKLKNLSSGMMARLAFATAHRADADILLLDEVLAVGDARFQQKCMETFSELRERHKTVVLISHDLATVERSCDQAFWLDNGRLIEAGDASRVVRTYLSMSQSLGVTGTMPAFGPTPDAAPQRIGDGRMRYVEGRLLDDAGVSTTRVMAGSRITLRLVAVAEGVCENPVFGLAVRRGKDEIYKTNTALLGIATGVFEPGDRIEIDVSLLAALANGQYIVDVATAAHLKGTLHDWVSNALTFLVENSTSQDGVADLLAEFSVACRATKPEEAQGPSS